MKPEFHLYEHVSAFENILLASRKARLGKRSNTDVASFEVNLERELCKLRRELRAGTYTPGPYTTFHVYEPKKRMISAAPYRDRVVHHALCNIIQPIIEKTFIHDSYANRVGKGTHKAIIRLQRFSRANTFVLKCDIRKFFPSIDHAILKQEIRKFIGCEETLWLIDTIIDHSNEQEPVLDYFWGDTLFTPIERRKGLPIGNLTSQFFANVHLNPLDHFVKENLRCRYYLRYVDDFVVLENDLHVLREVRTEIDQFLDGLRLRMHERKSRVHRVTEGVGYLGQRVFATHRRLRPENVHRMRRRLRKLQAELACGCIDLRTVSQSISSWIGHAMWADTHGLRRALLGEVAFVKGAGSEEQRVLRGGSWNNNENNCRVANRNRNTPTNINNNNGFRCAEDLTGRNAIAGASASTDTGGMQ
jgi:retron-type reverse transcriptase